MVISSLLPAQTLQGLHCVHSRSYCVDLKSGQIQGHLTIIEMKGNHVPGDGDIECTCSIEALIRMCTMAAYRSRFYQLSTKGTNISMQPLSIFPQLLYCEYMYMHDIVKRRDPSLHNAV